MTRSEASNIPNFWELVSEVSAASRNPDSALMAPMLVLLVIAIVLPDACCNQGVE
jgi:fumarate reductase subunit D